MYELCCRSVGLNIAVLPYSPASHCDRWILKLHGCITHPEDIVLTREHYMRYSTRRSALSGIVQSLLITRHMLFVGFSLTDDNFHRIIDEVRRSVRTGITDDQNSPRGDSQTPTSPLKYAPTFQERRFGTQLVLTETPVTTLLWDEDVYVVAMTGEDSPPSEQRNAARKFDIFLDYLLSLATSTTAFLLNPRYDALLEEGQRELRNAIYEFVKSLNASGKSAPEYLLLKKVFAELGLDEDHENVGTKQQEDTN